MLWWYHSIIESLTSFRRRRQELLQKAPRSRFAIEASTSSRARYSFLTTLMNMQSRWFGNSCASHGRL
jgi:hypothetical protein